MVDFLNQVLFNIGGIGLTMLMLFKIVVTTSILLLCYWLTIKKWLPSIQRRYSLSNDDLKKAKSSFPLLIFSIWLLLLLFILNANFSFYQHNTIDITLVLLVEAVSIFFLARILDWIISNIFINRYYKSRKAVLDNSSYNTDYIRGESNATGIIQPIVYTLAFILIIRSFNLDYSLYAVEVENGQMVNFRLSNIIKAVLVFLIARLIVWLLTQIFLFNIYRQKKVDVGAQFAINQLLNYVIYVVAAIMAIENLGINMTLIWGGAAALLVGVGLGLQSTFNDFASGIVLLFERSVKVGDVLEVENQVGTVKKIGLRSSLVETRGNITVVMPNSKLVNNKVINWTHFDDKVRFEISIGVAYGSDMDLVKKLLLESVEDNPYIVQFPAPFVRFLDFNESSLNLKLYFFSRNYIVIEDVKSDIRFVIDKKFRENNISIPFPQREVWINNKNESKS